ncbi:11091_t:CDS:1, partial [Ambispora gerdemannii]
LSLYEALSYVTPRINYALNASTSTSSTNAVSTPPTEVALWDRFFDEVDQFPFDRQEAKFQKPQFGNYDNVRNEEDLREAFSVNICHVLNNLIGPEYEFSRWQDHNPGIPDFNCTYVAQLILCIENKRALVIRDIGGRTFPEYYQSSLKARTVTQQVYNYMCDKQLQYGVLSTYEDHWFLRRPDETPTKLFISPALSSQSESPTVLKAYAYLAMRARASPPSPHPDIIMVPVDEDSEVMTQSKKRYVTRSMTRKEEKKPTQQPSPYALANQQNFSFADFKFKDLLGQGRSGKTLLCEFRGEKIALKTADLYKTPPNILKEMQKEAQIYKEDLKDIQGKYIPRLVCDGYYGGGWCYIFGTTFVGTHLSNDKKITTQQKSQALKALKEIHKR